MAKCMRCSAPIAWRKEWRTDVRTDDPTDGPRAVWIPHEPKMIDGVIQYAMHKNGGGRVVRRAVPSDIRHRCGDRPSSPPDHDKVLTAPLASASVSGRASSPVVSTVTLPGCVPIPLIDKPVTIVIDTDLTCDEEIPAPTPPAPVPTPQKKTPASATDYVIPASGQKAWERAKRLLMAPGLRTRRVLLTGPPGTGKTTLAYTLARECGWALHRITLTEESSGSVLIGQYVIKGGDVVWQDGAATQAMRESHHGPVLLVLDEVDHASGDATTRLLEVLNDPAMVELALPTGEVVRPKPENWRVMATTNADPSGGGFLAALIDRLHLCVTILYPHPDLVASCTQAPVRKLLCAGDREVSIRALLSFDALCADGWTQEDAALSVFGEASGRAMLDAMRLMS